MCSNTTVTGIVELWHYPKRHKADYYNAYPSKIREFQKLRLPLRRNCHSSNFAVDKVLCDYSLLFTLCEIDVVSFHLIDTNGFYITTEKKRWTAAGGGRGLVVVRTSNFKIWRRRLADYVKEMYLNACCTCSTIIFLYSTNHFIDLWHLVPTALLQLTNKGQVVPGLG